jgi:uncharacterized protein
MRNKEEIRITLEEIKKSVIPILKSYRVIKAGIFGSFARGEQNRKSDIDILIEVDNGTDLIELIQLKNILEKKVKRKVDIVEYRGIRKELKQNILNDEIEIL